LDLNAAAPIKYDQTALPQLARHRHDQRNYIFHAREQIELQEQLLTNDREINPSINDHAWDSDLYAASTTLRSNI
jgi:CPA2 family monovalent cation:H+ antiporter-2